MNTKLLAYLCLVVATVFGIAARSATRVTAGPIDVRKSKLTVFVYKAGLFSAFADNHVINAPIASGTITTTPAPAIELVVNAAELVPLDPDLDPAKRDEVRTRMLGAEVLDTGKFPTIRFASTTIEPAGPERWNVSGQLTIHGVTRAVTFPVVKADRVYRGETRIRQRDFGINPIRIAGGTVSVKDELKVEFQIADEHELRHSRTEACPPCERVRPTSACRRADRDDQCDSVLIRVLYPCESVVFIRGCLRPGSSVAYNPKQYSVPS